MTSQDGEKPVHFVGSGNVRERTVYFTWSHQVVPNHTGIPSHPTVEKFDGHSWSTPQKFGRPIHLDLDNIEMQVFRLPGVTHCPNIPAFAVKGEPPYHFTCNVLT